MYSRRIKKVVGMSFLNKIRVKDAMKMNLPVNSNIDGGKWYKIKARKIEDNAVPSTLSTDI